MRALSLLLLVLALASLGQAAVCRPSDTATLLDALSHDRCTQVQSVWFDDH